ncbi:tetratricopeptide repeat protein [Caulobacter hibisci]|uniref:Tetratricopeptide repeat protein n=1 Tax=Caulobacter hibisci TaxID=2035993 RepID=A0ABS0SXG2_9CAUL|nr:tetratricopeptide repeat protein [Caulobacter hibisci]MBI1684327.1 tetratricopeptide repeat protein [Caulobacter hibisci]
MRKSLTAVLMLVPLSGALGGCATLTRLAALVDHRPGPVEIRALPAPAAPDPAAATDRLYDRAAQAIKARNYALALELLQLAAQRAPGDARVLNAQGVVYDKLGRFDLSARYYDRALKADPGSRIVLGNMAYSARLQGREPAAEILQDATPPALLAGGPPVELAPLPGGGS